MHSAPETLWNCTDVNLSVLQFINIATQLVVFASPYVFSDDASQMTTNNASLFSGVIGNMITDTQSAGSVIPEKEYTLSNLTVNALHAALLGLLVTIILPILLLAGGIVIFMVRRKK